MEIYLKPILFIFLATAFICFFYELRRSRIIQRKLREAYESLDEAAVERARENKRNILMQESRHKSLAERIIEKPGRLFVYSGLERKFPGLTMEIWFLLILVSAAVLYALIFWITKNVLYGCILAAIYIAFIQCIEMICAFHNYKVIDENLIKFLNLLGNYSITTGEITGIFHQISRFLPDPLSSVLDECYYDAQISGDISSALYAMADKIEHPKFKEVVHNIEVCINYSANYKEVVNNSRKIIMDEQRARRERKSMANEASISMLLVSGLFVLAFVIVDKLIEKSIWTILFGTMIGKISIVAVVIIYIYFYFKILKVGR